MNYSLDELQSIEKEKALLLAEKAELLGGKVAIPFDGGGVANMRLEPLDAEMPDQQTQEERELRFLEENPFFLLVRNAFMTRGEVEEELKLKGFFPVENTQLQIKSVQPVEKLRAGFIGTLVARNNALNRKIVVLGFAGKLFASSFWMTILAILVFICWGGGVLLDTLTGKNTHIPVTTPTVTLTTTPSPTLFPTGTPDPNSGVPQKFLMSYFNQLTAEPTPTLVPTTGGVTQPIIPGIAYTPTPEPTPELETPGPDISGKRVGCPASPAGGNNGPHGCFNAPSFLSSRAVGITNVVISKAQVVEEVVPAEDKASVTPVAGAETETVRVVSSTLRVKIVAPPTGASTIAHYGAYPGEMGNMLLFATNTSLSQARLWQVGDELSFTDRKGNQFTYKILNFSPSGQAERVVDLADPADAWVLDPRQDTAIATFILPMTQALPQNITISVNSGVPKPALDDLTPTRRLAYRAALVIYAPAKTTTSGSKVMVPDTIWTPQSQTLLHNITTPAPTSTVTPVPATSSAPVSSTTVSTTPLPNLPDTGVGSDYTFDATPFIFLGLGLFLTIFISFWLLRKSHKPLQSTKEN